MRYTSGCGRTRALGHISMIGLCADGGQEHPRKSFERRSRNDCFRCVRPRSHSCFRRILETESAYRSAAARREKMWIAFHQVWLTEMPRIWEKYITTLNIQPDHFLQQSANQKLFEMLLSSHLSTPQSGSSQRCGEKFDQFVECLSDMAVASEHDDYLQYTREWIDKVNRGGLFPLNCGAYTLFIEIEKEVRATLAAYMGKPVESRESFREHVIDKIAQNEEVKWKWTIISQCINRQRCY